MDVFDNFRRNLTLLRIEKGLTSEELSLSLGFSKGRVSNIEKSSHHRPNVEELIILSKTFGKSLEDIVHKKAKVILESYGDEGCELNKEKPFCCRMGFVSELEERIRLLVHNEKVIEEFENKGGK